VDGADGIGDTEGKKPRRKAPGEPGEQRVSNSCLDSEQSSLKKLARFLLSAKRGRIFRKKSVDSFLAFQVQGTFHTQNPSTLISQLHEKEIRFKICLF